MRCWIAVSALTFTLVVRNAPAFAQDAGVTITRDELEKLIDERIAARAAASAPAPEPKKEPAPPPLGWADFSWVPGNYGSSESPLKAGPFTGELRIDTAYHFSFANPKDDTISGSSEVFRHNELQVTQIGVGGNFDYKGVQARLMTQFGMYSQTTPRNDASTAKLFDRTPRSNKEMSGAEIRKPSR